MPIKLQLQDGVILLFLLLMLLLCFETYSSYFLIFSNLNFKWIRTLSSSNSSIKHVEDVDALVDCLAGGLAELGRRYDEQQQKQDLLWLRFGFWWSFWLCFISQPSMKAFDNMFGFFAPHFHECIATFDLDAENLAQQDAETCALRPVDATCAMRKIRSSGINCGKQCAVIDPFGSFFCLERSDSDVTLLFWDFNSVLPSIDGRLFLSWKFRWQT